MLERIATFYDAALVEAARKWRFEPARRSGVPVRFRHHIEVVLRPAS
jgi:outer membrane biosynthesis protein TonB